MFSLPNGPVCFEFHPYQLNFRIRWPGLDILLRKGWLVKIRRGEEAGWGECAPLPSAGTEAPSRARRALERACGRRWEAEALLAHLQALAGPAPAAACALETALLDLEGRRRGLPLRRLLAPRAADAIAVNAMAGSACREATKEAVQAGFRVVKLKVGQDAPDRELHCLRELCATLPPEIRLRLDANRAWDPDGASRFLQRLEGLPVESLEEPLRDPDPATLRRLQETTPIALAADESLKELGTESFLEAAPVRRVVLKPMAHGGPARTLELAQRALEAGMVPLITSTLESAVGLHAACQLAAALDSLHPGTAHGLATASWLADDPSTPPRLERGRILLNDQPGLGMTP